MATHSVAVRGTVASGVRNTLIDKITALSITALMMFGSGTASAAGGYTYTQVRQFPSSDPNTPSGPAENLCDVAMNDLGQVAYVTSQANADGTQTESVHVWSNSGKDNIIFSGTTDVLLNPPNNYPYCGGTGGNSLGLAIDNQGIVSVQVWIFLGASPAAGYTYGLLFLDSGLVSGKTTYPVTPLGSETVGAVQTGNHANASGFRPYVLGTQQGTIVGAASATNVLSLTLPGGAGYFGDGGVVNQIPAINDSGQISLVTQAVNVNAGTIGPPTIIDVPPAPASPIFTPVGAPTWVFDGQIGMNNRGDIALMTIDAFRVVEQPANRSTAAIVLVDASTFTQSTASRAVSFSDWNEATFATTDAAPNPGLVPGIWSLASDGTPVEVFSGLDSTFNVFNPLTQTTTNLVGNGLLAENVMEGGTGNFSPSSEIVANNQGAVLFLGPALVVATPLPGLRPSVPLAPDSTDPTTKLMTFNSPCGLFYSGTGFLTPALSFGGFTGTCYVYPALAADYTLTAASGADNIQSITIPAPLPGGQTTFGLSFVPSNAPIGTSPTTASLIAGQTYVFPAGGVSSLTILGISTAQALNTNNMSAFVVGLAWVNHGSAPTGFTMQPLADNGPTITPTISGTLGSNGWYTSNVSVSWTVTDALSITSSPCSSTIISTDTIGQQVTCTATDSANNTATQTVTIKRDTTPPVAMATLSPMPDAYGWNNSTVTVTFTGTDSTSGIASCSGPVTISSQGANQTSPPGNCTDKAGNVSAPVSATNINIEVTPPTVSDAISDSVPESSTGWYTAPVTVTFAGTDPLSGVAPGACTAVTLSSNGAGQTVTGTCTNLAGDIGTLTVSGINIDTIAPIATAVASPPPNVNGWNNAPVTVSFVGTDAMSGSGIASCSPGVTFWYQGSPQIASGTCTDVAGNVSAPAVDIVNIDTTNPTIAISSPSYRAAVIQGGALAAGYVCTDALSGVATCTGSVSNGGALDTTTPGNFTLQVSATDQAGNSASATTPYTVEAIAGAVSSGGGTVSAADPAYANTAKVSFPSGVLGQSTEVAINVITILPTFNLPARVLSISSQYVQILLSPTPSYPLPAPGVTIVLPLLTAQAPGSVLQLYDIDGSGNLVPSLDSSSQAISGTVNADGLSATFAGIIDFSTLVAVTPANSYQVTDLGMLGSGTMNGRAINESGQVTGFGYITGGTTHTFLYSNGSLQDLGTLGGDSSQGSAINASGEVVGGSWTTADAAFDSFLYSAGAMEELPGNGATGINASGQISGNFSTSAFFTTSQGFVYSNGVTQSFGSISGFPSVSAAGINDSGQVVGTATNPSFGISPSVAFLYSDGVLQSLGTPNGAQYSSASAINASGEVAGNGIYTSTAGTSIAAVYVQGIWQSLGGLGGQGQSSQALGINASGQVVGSSSGPFSGTHATFYTGGRVLDLNLLIVGSLAQHVTLTDADGINDSGLIVANGIDSLSGQQHAYLLTPTTVTSPVITPNIAGTLGNNGWYTSNVTVSWSVTDPQSAISSSSGCGATTIATDTNGQTLTCTATSAGATSSQSVTIKRDTTPPLAAASQAPPANGAGWNNTNVTVSFAGTDSMSGSGIATCSAPVVLSATGAGQSASGTCTDIAGNVSATATVTGVNIDKTLPVVTLNTPANKATFTVGARATASYSCTSGPSSLNSCTGPVASGSLIDTSSAGTKSFAVTATDVAGNTATKTNTYTVTATGDTSPPTITPTLTGTLGANGWYTSTVGLTWNIVDPQSTVTSKICATPVTVTGNTLGVTHSCTATSAGGTATASVTIKLDATAPTAKATAKPAANANGWRKAPVTVTFAGGDATSGISSCSPAVNLSGDGAAQSASGSCTNNAGLVSAAATVSGINIDLTPPQASITTPASGTIYALGSSVLANFGCSDALSGIKTCTGTVANGTGVNTATKGNKNFSVTAVDLAGNSTKSTVTYTVK